MYHSQIKIPPKAFGEKSPNFLTANIPSIYTVYTIYLLWTHDTKVMALFNLRSLALGRTSESVARLTMFLELSVSQLDIAVLHEAVQTQSMFVRAVEHNHSVPTMREEGWIM